MKRRPISTYFFIGRLSPAEDCSKFHPGEIRLDKNWMLDICRDGISIWIPGTRKSFDELKPAVLDAFDIVINTFMLITGERLDFNFQNWVETRGIVSKSNMIGWIVSSFASKATPKKRNKFNVAWRKVGKFYPKILANFYHRMALRDFKSCITISGDDAFFYAYRIVEDIRRAVTINLADGLPTDKYWEEMHSILGTSKKQIDPLTRVAKYVRHGDTKSHIVRGARRRKKQLIEIALSVMKKEFKWTFKGLI